MNAATPRRSIALLLALSLAVGACEAGIGSAGTLTPASPAEQTPGESSAPPSAGPSGTPSGGAPTPASPTPTVAPTPAPTTSLAVYLFSGEQLVPVYRQVPQTVGVARAAMNALLAGPTPVEASGAAKLITIVPAGTRLLGISVANGVATVDLTGEFQSGGGSMSMFGRLAQVTWTLTQFPTVKGVALRLDGQPVTVFSSEGIVLDAPLRRADYVSFLPPIFVDRPAWNAPLGNPARVTGLANVFEAQFSVEISTAGGTLLASQNVMASCGTGCWGTFDVSIPYSVDRPQAGYLTVYDASPRDGSRENVRSYPVLLSPGG